MHADERGYDNYKYKSWNADERRWLVITTDLARAPSTPLTRDPDPSARGFDVRLERSASICVHLRPSAFPLL